MNQKLLAGIIIGIIVVLVVLTFLLGGKSLTKTSTNNQNSGTPSSQNQVPAALKVSPTAEPGETIMVSAHGFVPELLKIKSNASVNFANLSDSDTVDVEADDPKDSVLNTGVIKNNDTSSPVKLSVGTYKYHNKLKPTQTGTIVVQ